MADGSAVPLFLTQALVVAGPRTSPPIARTPARAPGLGALFAAIGQIKDASVAAFHRLSRELAAFNAPVRLVRSARRAAFDEMRHARAMNKLARMHGAEPTRVDAGELRTRSFDEMAFENAMEGCVRQTWDAALARWAGEHAVDEVVRFEMARIARDQTEHTTLAWRVLAWAMPRITPATRDRLRRAMKATVSALSAELHQEPAADAVQAGVLPNASAARAMFERMRETVWRDAQRCAGQ